MQKRAANGAPREGRARLLADRRLLYLLPVLALPIPLFVNDYVQYVINLALVYVLVGVGFNIVLGNLGQLAFANAAFFGIGAYATGILMHHLAVPFWIALLVGGGAGAAAGAITALPALRGIRLFYLAIITLAFGELMRWVYIHAEAVTLGSMGLAVPQPTFFGVVLATDTHKFYVFLAIVTLLVAATANLLHSRIGRAFMAIRDNELAAASMGIPTARYFVLAFAWSGFVVGVGGALYAALVRLVAPEAFNLAQLILHFAIVMVGGIGSLAGSVLGALVVTAAPEFMRDLPGFEELLFGALIVLILLFLPGGLASLLARYVPLFRERYFWE
ncbi:MAG TPA: branched-chain amino acid ABC transporter permease [Geminicoccaceae bacterium]|nr:branched-chain amino acid ABC transporter permease [Geminicoccaceae bacterium]